MSEQEKEYLMLKRKLLKMTEKKPYYTIMCPHCGKWVDFVKTNGGQLKIKKPQDEVTDFLNH